MTKHRVRAIDITIYREHGGRWWIDEDDIRKLAPKLERDMAEKFFVTIIASNCVDKSKEGT